MFYDSTAWGSYLTEGAAQSVAVGMSNTTGQDLTALDDLGWGQYLISGVSMPGKLHFGSACRVCTCLTQLPCADELSGTWKVSGISASSGAFNYTMVLKQNKDGTVTGKVKTEAMTIEGKYDGSSFTFFQRMDNGKVNTCNAEKTNPKLLQGTYTSSTGGSGNFSCMKKK